MKNLLKIVTNCIDKFAEQANMRRFAAIIGGGGAVILHGIPRTTLDVDILVLGEPSYLTPQRCILFFDQTGRFGAARGGSEPLNH